MKSLLQIVKSNKILSLIVVLVFFAKPLSIYLPSSIIIELCILLFFIYSYLTNRISFVLISRSAYSIFFVIFIYFIFSVAFTFDSSDPSGFVQENYRLLVFLLLLIVLLSCKIDYLSLAKLCLWCCRFHIFFTVFEFVHLTIIDTGNFASVPIVGPVMPELDSNSGYLRENDSLIMYGFRPFGLMLQPQKTGFVFLIGALLEYLVALYEKRKVSKIWNVLFIIVSIIQGAKTAMLLLFVVEAAILFNVFPDKKVSKGSTFFYLTFLFIFLYVLSKQIEITNIGNDTNLRVFQDINGFFSLPIINILFGIGMPVEKTLLSFGYSGEAFFMRIFTNLGIIVTTILFAFITTLFITKSRKTNYIIFIVFFGLIYHYCIINVYFIAFSFAVAICLAKSIDKNIICNHQLCHE